MSVDTVRRFLVQKQKGRRRRRRSHKPDYSRQRRRASERCLLPFRARAARRTAKALVLAAPSSSPPSPPPLPASTAANAMRLATIFDAARRVATRSLACSHRDDARLSSSIRSTIKNFDRNNEAARLYDRRAAVGAKRKKTTNNWLLVLFDFLSINFEYEPTTLVC